jgi:NAD(P)-dependent dehydrogenase (short-subunit alcohol dehydrogenase family)
MMLHQALAGQTAWVSGAASGIGKATACLFAEQGAAVAVIDRRFDTAAAVADSIILRGGRALAVACDVADPLQIEASITATLEKFGGLQIVVNNAGIVQVKWLHECNDLDFDEVMDVNVRSMMHAFRLAYPYLKKNVRSYVVNVGSVSSFVGQAQTPLYTATKHAVLGLTRSIALDYAIDGIRCNCVCPGITDTPMLQAHLNNLTNPTAALSDRLRRVCTGRAITPSEVAHAILYLSCETSPGVTGTSLVVDGGYLAAAEWDNAEQVAHIHTERMNSGAKPE